MELPKKLYHGNRQNHSLIPLNAEGFIFTSSDRDEALWKGAKHAIRATIAAHCDISITETEIVIDRVYRAINDILLEKLVNLHFTLYEIDPRITLGHWTNIEYHPTCWKCNTPLHLFNDKRDLRLKDVYKGRILRLIPENGSPLERSL